MKIAYKFVDENKRRMKLLKKRKDAKLIEELK